MEVDPIPGNAFDRLFSEWFNPYDKFEHAECISILGNRLGRHTRSENMTMALFAADASKLIKTFKPCILNSISHIYISLLTLSPEGSIAAEHYRSKLAFMVIPRLSWPSDENQAVWKDESSSIVEEELRTVRTMSFSHSDLSLAAGYGGGGLRVWKVETGEYTVITDASASGVLSVCFSPDDLLIASSHRQGEIYVWNAIAAVRILGPLFHPSNSHARVPVTSVAYSPDSTRIASGSEDKSICIWDSRTGSHVLAPLEGHTAGIISLPLILSSWCAHCIWVPRFDNSNLECSVRRLPLGIAPKKRWPDHFPSFLSRWTPPPQLFWRQCTGLGCAE